MAGDTFGLILQVLALATGPVVLIQPLLILALPISLPISRLLGGPKPNRGALPVLPVDRRWAGRLLCHRRQSRRRRSTVDPTGRRRHADPRGLRDCWLSGLCVAERALSRPPSTERSPARGSDWSPFFWIRWRRRGRQDGIVGFGHADGLSRSSRLLLLGGASIALTQVAFQVGELGASFPANLAADPVVAVVLGAVLLHERVPATPWAIIGYLVCLGAILFGAVRLAADPKRQKVSA